MHTQNGEKLVNWSLFIFGFHGSNSNETQQNDCVEKLLECEEWWEIEKKKQESNNNNNNNGSNKGI